MQIVKQAVTSTEWVLRFSVRGAILVVPLSLIKSSLLFLAICAVFVLAFNTGQLAAAQQVEYSAYMCTKGCYADAAGGRIIWLCPNETGYDSFKYERVK